jgi:hypothetical protein
VAAIGSPGLLHGGRYDPNPLTWVGRHPRRVSPLKGPPLTTRGRPLSLVVLIAVLCGGAVLGLIGALLAIPIAGTIHAVVSELLAERAERINGTPKLGVSE